MTAYNAAAEAGMDSEFHKDPATLFSFQQGPFYSAELHLGAAKAFGGRDGGALHYHPQTCKPIFNLP